MEKRSNNIKNWLFSHLFLLVNSCMHLFGKLFPKKIEKQDLLKSPPNSPNLEAHTPTQIPSVPIKTSTENSQNDLARLIMEALNKGPIEISDTETDINYILIEPMSPENKFDNFDNLDNPETTIVFLEFEVISEDAVNPTKKSSEKSDTSSSTLFPPSNRLH